MTSMSTADGKFTYAYNPTFNLNEMKSDSFGINGFYQNISNSKEELMRTIGIRRNINDELMNFNNEEFKYWKPHRIASKEYDQIFDET